MKQTLCYKEIQAELDKMLGSKESDELEFKTAKGGFPGSFWETYSSFANTNGGTIVLGVKEIDGKFLLDGLDEPTTEKYRKDFFNMMNNKQKVNVPLVRDPDVKTICKEGNYFMFIYVPRADREMRPVYTGQDPYTGSFRRGNDGDYHCRRSEVNSMFADANIANPVDGRILQHYTIEDLDMNSVRQYRQLFQMANPDHVWNALPTGQFLRKLNVVRRDRETGAEGLTFAGLLMFGTYSAITENNPNFFPDYQEIQSTDTRWVNRICPDGNWESNLFQFYQRVLPILQSFLPKPFRLEGNQRISETSAHVAIREALTNTLVHPDYTVNASVCVYKYQNRIVFSNPGTMLIPIRQYYKGGESICRNKYLQTMFTFLGFADKAGSGADKIINGWTAQNWQRPYIEEQLGPNKVVLTMTMESLFDERIKQWLTDRFGKHVMELSHDKFTALALAYSEREISNDRLQSVLDMHRTDITQLLGDLCTDGFLVGKGYGRGKKYHIAEVEKGASSEAKVESSEPKVESSEPKVESTKAKVESSEAKVESSGDKIASTDTMVARSMKRYSFNELKLLILEACQEWCTIDYISEYTDRGKWYLRNKVMPRLNDSIEMMYKDNPTHPRQKYKKKS